MALPYSPPRTVWDVTVNLETSAVRNFEGATYSGKHVRVIGDPNTIDTRSTLIFNGCASVSIFGGYFRPTARNRYGGITTTGGIGPGTFTFNTVGNVYIEGVVIDNINIFGSGGDAVFCTAKTALTTVTIQNCHFKNVRGLQSDANAHGDVFQTGSTDMGKCGPVRVHNFTSSGNYQGFYVNPQSGGGITSLTMSRVNMKRTSGADLSTKLIYLFQPASVYDGATGYPVSFNEVWVNGGAGQDVLDCIWPSNFTGSGNWFPSSKHWAVRSSEVKDGATVFYATYPNLTDAGKQVTGKIYEGDPPDGDFAPESKVGLNYVAGTDLAIPTVDPDVPGAPWTAQPGGNLLLQQNWTKSGPGTVSINGLTGQIAIAASGTRTSASQIIPTEIGSSYRLTYHTNTSEQISSPVGSSSTVLSDYVADALRTPAPGDQGFTFTATTTSAYLSFTRTSSAAPQASSIILEKMPAGAGTARRLNGLNQYFNLNVSGASLRAANYNFFIGGWFKWSYMPAGAVYIMDFGDQTPTAGSGRCRIAYDPTNSKLFCSTGALDGSSYRERALTTTLTRDVWYHVAMLMPASGDPQLYFNGALVGTLSGTAVPPSETVCNKLTFGARLGASPTNFNPARYADWVWCSNSVPGGTQITALAAKTRPNAITGFSPTYWWAFDQTSTTEPSLGAAATLTAAGAPITVLGLTAAETPVTSSRPTRFIVI